MTIIKPVRYADLDEQTRANLDAINRERPYLIGESYSNFVLDVWRGNYSLGMHFWVFLVIPSFVLNVIGLVVPWEKIAPYGLLYPVGALVIWITGVVGFFRCVKNGNFKRQWLANIAIIVVCLGIIRTVVQVWDGIVTLMQ